MKFELNKADLDTAIKNFLTVMNISLINKKVEIKFRVGRTNRFGTSETYAEVDIEPIDPGTSSVISKQTQLDLDL